MESHDKPVERRRYPRADIVSGLRARVASSQAPVAVLDMSAGGFAVQTSIDLGVGSLHDFRLTPDRGEPLTVTARVVHTLRLTAPNGSVHYITGLEFVENEADGSSIRAVERLMSTLPRV